MEKTLFVLVACLMLALPATAKAAAPAAKALPKVTVVATGGTIASGATSSTELTDYKAAAFSAEQLISAVPALKDCAQISAEQIVNIGSSNLTMDVLLKVAKRVNELLAGDVDGVVITHGTDTMEETAYFMNLVIKSKKPVVLVGSMRPATAISADGPLNLLQAVAVAGSKEAVGKGVMVIMNGQINAARDVTKTNTLLPETFRSNDMGFMGYVVDSKPEFYRQPMRKHTADTEFDVRGLTALPKVEIIYGYLDAGLDALNGIIAGKPAGIVCAAVGNGSLATPYNDLLTKASKSGIVVVRSSRVGTGVVTPRSTDAEPGYLTADNLNPQKARILLMLALTKTKDPKEIQRMFKTY